jgi:Arc/MetJ-type ribon-helix-helix transcriptional regulator
MEIRLRPELADRIKQDVQRGSYKTVNEFVEREFRCSTNRKLGSAQNRAEIAARIDEGYAAAQRGELIDADAARSRLKELKQVRADKTQRG